MFSGSIPALVTPFRDGAFDEKAFRRLVDWQIESGSSALVPCGTTGEASTLSNDEHHRVIEVCIEQAAGRVPVIAGCGSNDTMNALLHMETSQQLGADAALVVAPYYNRPSQEGMLAHFSYLAEHSDLPIVLYNVPGRTVTDLKPATVIELARRFPGKIIGMKDASGDPGRVTEHRLGIGAEFCQMSGDDGLALPFLAAGATGCISVTANVAPGLCAKFQAAWAAGDVAGARALNDRLYPLHSAMFCDASPGPVKYAMARVLDWMAGDLRLPMTPCDEAGRKVVDAALVHAGLI
ncbi:MAG TPA: 4-hydroxy-tetrahydrodipicolinate synthase [Novosphingobium sp.]|jgi:4-hydroxy-tetrahydrodipicolinate synthase|nr:4-hydroxy-tetrahydrodipicolinate synthase [Novosphingobium sp.]